MVISMYYKSGGKRGTHAWTEMVNNVVAKSNFMVQFYEPKGTGSIQWSLRQHHKFFRGNSLTTSAVLQSENVLRVPNDSPRWMILGQKVNVPHWACLDTNPIWQHFDLIVQTCPTLPLEDSE
jgi:hypothetical protein